MSSSAEDSHLILGASGQVGGHLYDALAQHHLRVQGTYRTFALENLHQLDVRDAERVQNLLSEIRPTVVYVPAALGNADWCETHPQESYAINVTGLANVARAAQQIDAKLVYFSSDYVFDGTAGPYRENDLACPICEYGRQKVLAEHYLALQHPNSLIIRTTVVYGWERQDKNFVQRLREVLGRGEHLRVPHDQIGSPTYAPDLAEATIELVRKGATGVFHVVGPELANRYEFATEAARVFGLDENLIDAVTTKELAQTAPRPLRAGMRVEKAVAKLGRPLLGYRAGLRTMAEAARTSE